VPVNGFELLHAMWASKENIYALDVAEVFIHLPCAAPRRAERAWSLQRQPAQGGQRRGMRGRALLADKSTASSLP
jgi:hypothetical protein